LPSTTLRAYGFLVLSLILRPKTAACNNGAGEYTKGHVKLLTHLTEPQGKIKKRESVKLLLQSLHLDT